jgi:hypothetical protein
MDLRLDPILMVFVDPQDLVMDMGRVQRLVFVHS